MSDNNNNNNNSSNNDTLGSYVDSATGYAKQTVGYTQDNQRNTGTWDQTLGSAKESLGNLSGSENLRRQGVEQNTAGKETEAKGQLRDLGEGVTDRAQGKLGAVEAAVTGDREEEEKWRKTHDEGKGRQREAAEDIDRKGAY